MTRVNKLEDIKILLEENRFILLYFGAENCSVCEVLRPKIEDSLKENFPKIKSLFIENLIDINVEFGVFSNPTIILMIDKKEFKRYGRNISLNIFNSEIKRLYDMVY
ncbi:MULTISPECIES: thioredoxin family protein [Arcobacteraceae]|uniref:Thioredoxin n=2 Tax=Arcobacteraceae TaxID=2808963 RepID=A0A1C0B1B2_9BACT|nr:MULTISPECIES: thioredoxin family protein [Arcobacteraceae]OCL83006.1 hypothetical protein AAW30_01075 [Arcobacter porcinus]OCL88906.1 hypothetical protein AAX30_00030 [Arcobacter porcinus]OCL89888.1 hypothetical protein AAX27_01703 [Aliarcobacter thereius]OCL93652.1 hypothetical protein AAX28_01203 [Arcobacter porcinus]OCL94602.1 hypothetical protein AA347_00033 [Aliarcobacter thereius LMG 24486]